MSGIILKRTHTEGGGGRTGVRYRVDGPQGSILCFIFFLSFSSMTWMKLVIPQTYCPCMVMTQTLHWSEATLGKPYKLYLFQNKLFRLPV